MSFPTMLVQVGFTVGASTGTLLHLDDSERGLLGTGTLAASVVWTDISADVRSVKTSRPVARSGNVLLQYEAGTCEIELNDNARDYDPTNLDGPYVAGGVTQVTPMRSVRVWISNAGLKYALWQGFADSWTHTYPGPNQTICTLRATDAFKVLRAVERTAVASVGSGEDSGARINRILDAAGWPAADRVIEAGDSTLQATTLDGNVLSEMQLATDSELGELYVDRFGRITFRRRSGILEDSPSNTSQATFGDGGGAELPYESVGISYDDTQLVNQARITRAGGSEQVVSDSESVQSFLTHSFERSDLLLQTDSAADEYARWVVHQGKDPELRFDSLTINPRNADSATEITLFAAVAGVVDLGERITIVRRPPGGGTITRDVFVRGVEHDITAGKHWRTTWELQSATKYSFLLLDHTTLGVLGSNALAF